MAKPPASPGTPRIHPVVLSGGSGTRLWPMSRESFPKQLLPLASADSLLQETVRRVQGADFAPPLIVCNNDHRFVIAEQLQRIAATPREIVLEPAARNTAPAAIVAALILAESDPDALMLVLPSDHLIRDVPGFHLALKQAASVARSGMLVTFGAKPSKAETGYGYIRRGAALDGAKGCYRVDRFVEKPDTARAAAFLAEGGWYWNSGMFMFSARRFLEEAGQFEPAMLAACRRAVAKGQHDLDFLRLGVEDFAAAPARSIDHAVMEHTDSAAVIPVDIGWSDVGSWSSLWDIGDKDEAENVVAGDVALHAVRRSYVRGEGRLVCALGVEDLIVVATGDVVLVAAMDRAQEVRGIVERLKASGRSEPMNHAWVHRPWGSFQTIDSGDRFQVKRLSVKPGARLSLQRHAHRAEHWVVVNGTARVTRGEETLTLVENESTFIPLGVVHRLENPGPGPLNLIEVQSGGYLGEDDIVRLDDNYGRS